MSTVEAFATIAAIVNKAGLRVLIAVVALFLTGCATHSVTTTTNKDGSVTVTEKSSTDPLLAKSVEDESDGYGLDLNFMGSSSFSPFHIKVGIFRNMFRTIPTSTNRVFAPFISSTGHRNQSIIQQASDNNFSTSPKGLPAGAYVGPNVQTANPITPISQPTPGPVSTNSVR